MGQVCRSVSLFPQQKNIQGSKACFVNFSTWSWLCSPSSSSVFIGRIHDLHTAPTTPLCLTLAIQNWHTGEGQWTMLFHLLTWCWQQSLCVYSLNKCIIHQSKLAIIEGDGAFWGFPILMILKVLQFINTEGENWHYDWGAPIFLWLLVFLSYCFVNCPLITLYRSKFPVGWHIKGYVQAGLQFHTGSSSADLQQSVYVLPYFSNKFVICSNSIQGPNNLPMLNAYFSKFSSKDEPNMQKLEISNFNNKTKNEALILQVLLGIKPALSQAHSIDRVLLDRTCFGATSHSSQYLFKPKQYSPLHSYGDSHLILQLLGWSLLVLLPLFFCKTPPPLPNSLDNISQWHPLLRPYTLFELRPNRLCLFLWKERVASFAMFPWQRCSRSFLDWRVGRCVSGCCSLQCVEARVMYSEGRL